MWGQPIDGLETWLCLVPTIDLGRVPTFAMFYADQQNGIFILQCNRQFSANSGPLFILTANNLDIQK